MTSSSSSSSPAPSGPGRSMAAAMGMGADWDRILSYIPPSRLATPEQQQRLSQMQLSMMMGVKSMQVKQRTNQTTQPPPLQQRNGRQGVREEKEVEEVDEEEEMDDSELLDEEGDDEEIRAMKAELRQLRADKTANTAATHPPANQPPPQPQPAPSRAFTQPTDIDLAALVDRLTVASSLDDPD